MIPHSKVAKLNRYIHDDNFSRVMHIVEAALDEGLDCFELDVKRLDEEMKLDLIDAFEVMGYTFMYDPEAQWITIAYDD